MFFELLKLIGKKEYSSKIPLEDFTTESLAGILKLNPNILDKYIAFIGLPEDDYKIETQLWKRLPIDQRDCYIDMVFRGNANICFVENKVESHEGVDQLLKYSEVLNTYFKDYNMNLHYCTKYSEPKNQNNEYEDLNFKQYKWFEIAKFLKPYKENNALVNDFLNFLEHYKMAQDNTLRIENLLSMQNMYKTIEIIEGHLENSKDEFENQFGLTKTNSNFNWKQLKDHERFCNYRDNILESQSYSEVLYSIQLNDLTLSTHIYVSSNHEKINDFNKIEVEEPLKKLEMEHGTSIYMIDDLTKYLNKEDSDKTIKKWFLKSFEMMKQFMRDNSGIGWIYKFE